MTDHAEELPDDFPLLNMDHSRPMICTAWGRKRSGKTVWNRELYKSWPGDKLCIDVNGNAEPGADATPVPLPIGTKWPEPAAVLGQRRQPQNLHYRAHPGADAYREDLDRAVRLALYPQDHRTLLWAGEVGELMPNGRPGPHMRTLLMQNRHYNVSAVFDGPRPVNVDPLVLAQSDLVAVYPLPNPADRKRIADSIGYPPKRFDAECDETWRRGPHWYLLWDANSHQLWRCPPLPITDDPPAAP